MLLITEHICLLLLRLTHPEVPYSSGATSSTNNPEFVEDLSQGQLLQNEASNTAEGTEQRHEDEVSWRSISSCYQSLKFLKKQSAKELIEAFILWPPYILQNFLHRTILMVSHKTILMVLMTQRQVDSFSPCLINLYLHHTRCSTNAYWMNEWFT